MKEKTLCNIYYFCLLTVHSGTDLADPCFQADK